MKLAVVGLMSFLKSVNHVPMYLLAFVTTKLAVGDLILFSC